MKAESIENKIKSQFQERPLYQFFSELAQVFDLAARAFRGLFQKPFEKPFLSSNWKKLE